MIEPHNHLNMKSTKNNIQNYYRNKGFGNGRSGEIYWNLKANERELMYNKVEKLKENFWQMYETKHEATNK